MSERRELLNNLRQLVELDRGFGVEFALRPAAPPPPTLAAPAKPAPPALRVADGPAAPTATVPARGPLLASAAPTRTPPAAAVAPGPELGTAELLVAPPGEALTAVAARIAACRLCKLCAGRTNTVPGEGAATPELMFVGEGPGADEDAQGRPFVGAAGQLLDKMIVGMGFKRGEVFIANVLKCRPPGNRTPEPDEVAACMPYLRAQIAILRPKLICTLGNTPLRALLADDTLGITRLRGKTFDFQGIPLIPTFHPSYLLRNPAAKKPCWEDLQVVLKALGRTPPKRGATE